jgi:hypothetical protein
MRRWAATLGLAAFCFCSSAWAQDAATPPPDAAKILVATKILEETHAVDNMTTVMDTMIVPMIRNIKQQNPALPDDQLKMISDMLTDELHKLIPQAIALNAQVYSNHFTLEELQQIEAFYESPIGQKIVVEQPKIVKEVLPVGIAWGRQAAQQALERIIEQLRKQGVKI